LLLASPLLSSAGEAAADAAEAWSLHLGNADAACGTALADDAGEGLELRQLRVRRAADADPELAAGPAGGGDAAIARAGEGADDDFDAGVPGGWGEAANFTETEHKDKEEYIKAVIGRIGLQSASRATTCAQTGCTRYYISWRSCQCNAQCVSHGSCCPDYQEQCVRKRDDSCSRLGCQDHYISGLSCQCNSECASHGSCCSDYQDKCNWQHHPAERADDLVDSQGGEDDDDEESKIMTLYHNTGYSAGMAILANGFRPGTKGWCGGGIYFATSPKATLTKAIGPDSHQGFMIEAQVDVGKVVHADSECKINGRTVTGRRLEGTKYDSVSFDPGDGVEYIVYDSARVLSTKQVAFAT